MAETTHIHVRDARDRLIDLLGLGETYPLRDLEVRSEQLTVAYNTTAKIPIDASQEYVTYHLHDKDGKPVVNSANNPVIAEGNGETILLETPAISADATYQILAAKLETGRKAYLHQAATVKVGLDTAIKAYIDAPLLDPANENPAYTDARIVHYGASIQVIIEKSQEGVDYRLVGLSEQGDGRYAEIEISGPLLFSTSAEDIQDETLDLPDSLRTAFEANGVELTDSAVIRNELKAVTWLIKDIGHHKTYVARKNGDRLDIYDAAVTRGNLEEIQLPSQPMFADTDTGIRATKTFDPSEGISTKTALLARDDAPAKPRLLPLKVMANPSLKAAALPSPISGYTADASISISDTQKSVQYRLYVKPIADREIIHRDVAEAKVLRVRLENQADVRVLKPEHHEIWEPAEGYEPAGQYHQGTGDGLQLVLKNMIRDSLILIRAHKEHRASEDRLLPSDVQLEQAIAVLVRPNPLPALQLQVVAAEDETTGEMQVSGGQPGVFYHFRTRADGEDIGRPAYFHQRDEDDPELNKGVNQLALSVDFVVATDSSALITEASLDRPDDPARTPPASPVLMTGRLPMDATLHVHAVKAQTRVATPLERTARLSALPEIRPETVAVDAGKQASILVIKSIEGERYQLLLNGTPVKQARNGNGGDIVFVTDAITGDTQFELLITRPAEQGIPVEKISRLTIFIKPATNLSVHAVAAEVESNTGTEIHIHASQPEVFYQLSVNGNTVGEEVKGTGSDIRLATGPISSETIFTVQARREDHPEISATLDTEIKVMVKP